MDTTQEEQLVDDLERLEEPDLGPIKQVIPEPNPSQEVFAEDAERLEEDDDVRGRAEDQEPEELFENVPLAEIADEANEEDDVVDVVEETQRKQLKAMIVPQRNAGESFQQPRRVAVIKFSAKRVRLEESTPVPKRRRKKAVKPAETLDGWTEAVKYYTVLLVLSCLKTFKKPPERIKKRVFRYSEMEEVSSVYRFKFIRFCFQEQPETGEVHITEDDVLDTGDYRGLNSYCAEKTNTVKDPIRTRDRCQKREDLETDQWLHIPTPIINAADYSQDEIKKLAQRPKVCIRGLDQASNRHGAEIVLENFRLSSKVGDHKFSKVDAYKQMAQQLQTNCDLRTGESTDSKLK